MEVATRFQRGDIVQLNTGGARMVVDNIEGRAGNVVRCKWYEGGERRVDRFFIDALHHFQLKAK